ncbi:MAG: DNA repair protein RecN [Bacilli bacterium]
MLEELRIVNFAIIDDIDIVFKPKLNGLVGETGAGKSIIVDALSLLSGSRSSFNKLRDESKKAFIEGVFTFRKSFLKQHEIILDYLDENQRLIVSRSLLPSKMSLARINGETVSLKVLKQVMEGIIDIHSQNDSSYLLQSSHHLTLLDSFLGTEHAKLLNRYQAKFEELKRERQKKEDFKKDNDINQREFLEFQIAEIEKFDLKENEIEDLQEELDNLSGYERLQESFASFKQIINSGEDNNLVMDVLARLENVSRGLNGTYLEKEGEYICAKANELEDAINEAFDSFESLDYSPERLEEINARLFELSTLQRKYGKTTDSILSAYREFKQKLAQLEEYDDMLEYFDRRIQSIEVELNTLGDELTSSREKGGEYLTKLVNRELDSLGLLSDGFKVNINPSAMNKFGKDSVNFAVCLNRGSKFMPLKEAASGGESSRLMLALKTVFNKTSPYDILVFDEIDTGISGNIAFKAAKKIMSIAEDSMVILISHLPQVVAACQSTYLVYKNEEKGITKSHIKPLNEREKIQEIGRMVSGSDITQGGIDAAKELINQYQK